MLQSGWGGAGGVLAVRSGVGVGVLQSKGDGVLHSSAILVLFSATLVLSAHPHTLSCFIPPIVDGPGYSLIDLTDAAAPVPIGSIQVHHCNIVHSDASFVLTWFWQILYWLGKMLQIKGMITSQANEACAEVMALHVYRHKVSTQTPSHSTIA